MKKTLALALALVMMSSLFCLCVSAVDMTKLDGCTVEDYVIDKTEATAAYGTPVIDGVIDDVWKSTTWYRSDPNAEWSNPDASEMYYYTAFMWDEGNLYITVYAVNDNEVLYGSSDTRDRVSYYLDTLNEDNAAFGSGNGDFGAILYVHDPNNDGKYSDGAIETKWRQYNESLDYDALAESSDYSCTFGDDWWIIEAKFAVGAYNPDIKFKEGNKAGIDMTVRDHSSAGDTKAINFSTNWDAWENPNEYGTVTFVKAAAPVAETEPAPAETADTAAAAEPVDTAASESVTAAPQTADVIVLMSVISAIAAVGGFTTIKKSGKRK